MGWKLKRSVHVERTVLVSSQNPTVAVLVNTERHITLFAQRREVRAQREILRRGKHEGTEIKGEFRC